MTARRMRANPKLPGNLVHGEEHDEKFSCLHAQPHCFPVVMAPPVVEADMMSSSTGVPDWPGRVHTSAPHQRREGCDSAPYCHPVKQEVKPKPEASYYDGEGGMQPWDVWKAFDLDPWEANLIKYVLRAGKKPGESKLKDLKKARSYLNYLIDRERSDGNE